MVINQIEKSVLTGVLVDVLKKMAGVEASPREPDGKPFPVAVIIGMSSPTLRMAVMLQMNEALARRLAGAMLQDPEVAWGRDAEDAIGELTNILAGNIKPYVSPGLSLALPTVIKGTDISISMPRISAQQTEVYECLGEILSLTLAQEA